MQGAQLSGCFLTVVSDALTADLVFCGIILYKSIHTLKVCRVLQQRLDVCDGQSSSFDGLQW